MNAKDRKSLRGTIFVNAGVNSGCPFCRALNADRPKIGDIIKVLNGLDAGRIGEVIGDETCLPIRDPSSQMDEFSTTGVLSLLPWEIMVHVDGSKYRSILSINDDLLEPEPFSPIPDWAPPISFLWAADIHSFIMDICNESFYNGKCEFIKSALFRSITYILIRRLPIESIDFWAILEAHGFPLKWKKRLLTLYEDCKEAVIIYHSWNTGRNYRNHKKVSPFLIE